MNKTLRTIADRISNLVYILAPGLYLASRRTRVILACCAAAGVVTTVILAVRSCTPGDGPTGYRINVSSLSSVDEKGSRWSMELVTGQPRYFYSSTRLRPGPPLLVSTTVEYKGANALVGLEVKGQAGEKYIGGVMKDGKRLEAPKFEIVGEDGKVLVTGQFKYG